ncbi:MAG: glycosyltransferase family 4 protein [Candidatus Dormibacteraceae bacterium]
MHRLGFVLEQTLGHVAHGRNLERALAKETNVDPTVIRVGYSGPEGVQRLPGLRTWSWRASMVARNGLRDALQRGPLDSIFIHTQVAALLAGEIMRSIPTVISLDATPRLFDREGEAYGHRRSPEVVELLKRRANMRAFTAATRLVTWCQWAAYSLVSEYDVPADKIDVIPPGVDLDLFRPSLVPKRSERVRLLFVGGEFDRKGGPDLLEAARILGDSVELDLVTSSADPVIPAGVQARVHRNLQPQSDELVSLYRRAHIFVLPSRGDCMPQAVTEALGCSLPVVATRVGAIPEMVTDNVNGYLVPTRDPRTLAAAIDSLVKSPGRRNEMGRWGRVLAQQEYDATRNNRRIFALMKSLAQRRLAAVKSA